MANILWRFQGVGLLVFFPPFFSPSAFLPVFFTFLGSVTCPSLFFFSLTVSFSVSYSLEGFPLSTAFSCIFLLIFRFVFDGCVSFAYLR